MDRAALEAKSFEDLSYLWSDAHKDLYDFRPRHTPSKEELVEFWATFEDRFARKQAEEADIEARMQDRLNECIDAILDTVKDATVARAMMMLAENAGVQIYKGRADWEALDWEFGVKFGTCKRLYERA